MGHTQGLGATSVRVNSLGLPGVLTAHVVANIVGLFERRHVLLLGPGEGVLEICLGKCHDERRSGAIFILTDTCKSTL